MGLKCSTWLGGDPLEHARDGLAALYGVHRTEHGPVGRPRGSQEEGLVRRGGEGRLHAGLDLVGWLVGWLGIGRKEGGKVENRKKMRGFQS